MGNAGNPAFDDRGYLESRIDPRMSLEKIFSVLETGPTQLLVAFYRDKEGGAERLIQI
jgi:hypothetical protein